MNVIDWTSSQSEILINPRLSAQEQKEICEGLQKSTPLPKGHYWLATSGSTGVNKWAALSKEAILASARAVNQWLESTSKDSWVNSLPLFHVGGLGILARAHLSGAKVIDLHTAWQGKWNPDHYHRILQESQATWSALVPTQVYDLVVRQLSPPESLKGIIVGGGKLSQPLYDKAISLGWKLLPSYGMTESSSQIATASIHSCNNQGLAMHLLDHMQVQITDEDYIQLKSPALLTLYGIKTQKGFEFHDPKEHGWFTTEDRGQLNGSILTVWGRHFDQIKIGGENVDLNRLETIWEKICLKHAMTTKAVLAAVEDERLGHSIHLFIEGVKSSDMQKCVDEYHHMVMPFEKIRNVQLFDTLPRSAIGKFIKRP
jgi:O-succinylbenzoic acid--CoA ligase